jgi:cytochrome c oxidase cbb3-type subunit 3
VVDVAVLHHHRVRVVYLALYPGLGSFSRASRVVVDRPVRGEQQKAARRGRPVFAKYVKMDLKEVAADPEAREMGERLFLTYCAQCHGPTAGAARASRT